MKILFVSPEFEEKGRGITGIIKSMINAAKAAGHEVGILVGYPDISFHKSKLLDEKIEHVYLQHYARDGKDSFKNLYPGGLRRKKNMAKILSSRAYLKYYEFPVKQEYFNSDPGILKNVDFCVKIPFCYQFINHGFSKLPIRMIGKSVRKFGVDMVITGAPMDITKKDVSPALLGQFVHDVMPLELIETPADNDTPRKFAKQLYAAATGSDIVFSNSQDTTAKVHEINSEANVVTVYGIASNKAHEVSESAILQNSGLTDNNYLMFVSVIEKRKNIINLLDAYSLAYDELNMPLVIVGGQGFGYKEIMAKYKSLSNKVRKNIIFTGFVSEEDKYTLLKHARGFVFPSVYEGIGLPVIEAFSCNLPVLTSRRGALPEAGGDAALYVENPYDVKEIASKMVQLAQDEKLRKELRANARKQIEKFTADKFNSRFKKGLESVSDK